MTYVTKCLQRINVTILLFHSFSTCPLPKVKDFSYQETTSSAHCWYLSVSCHVTTVSAHCWYLSVSCHVTTASAHCWYLSVSCHVTTASTSRRFSDAFPQLRKVTTGFVMSVSPSVHMEQLGSRWMDFHEISYLSFFPRKSEETFQV